MVASSTTKKSETKNLEATPGAKKKSSAYTDYMKTALVELKASNPSMGHKERFKLAAQNWKKDPTNPKREKA